MRSSGDKLQHDWRRKSFNRGSYAKSPEEIDRHAKDVALRSIGRYYRGLAKHWPEPDAGLLRCGHCGAKLLAQYPGPRVIRYQCSGYLQNRDRACCVMFGGLRADRLVSEQLLQALAAVRHRSGG
jgi:hypothetical protein